MGLQKNDENFAAGEDKKFVGIYLFCDRIINGRSDCISIKINMSRVAEQMAIS